MDQSYQFYIFMLSIITLPTDIQSMDDDLKDWFDAQKQCLGYGITIEKNKSDQPYWTGIYRRLTPWINILGCYSDSIANNVVEKTMIISSVGMCQEICYHKNGYKFALKMNKCVCIERDVSVYTFNRLSPSACNYTCEDNTDVIYSENCGGKHAFNLFEFQGVNFNTEETCLSVQCSAGDKRFFPKRCSESLDKVCENFGIPDNGFASSWYLSMEQCRKSQPSAYLMGEINLNNPDLVCTNITHQVVWVGVARHKYKSIDQGCEIKEEDKKTFQDCQMCINDNCCFKSCFELTTSPIFCQSISDTSHGKKSANLTASRGSSCASNFISNHLTAKQMFASQSTTGNCDKDQLTLIKDAPKKSGASDNLALKITLPLIIGLIIVLLCAVGVMFYRRRTKQTKTNMTTKAVVEPVPETNVDDELNPVQNYSYFILEQCSQKIHTVSDSPNESPYNNSEEGVYDHLRDKKSRKPEVEDTYQHASADVSRDMSEYDTMSNVVNKKQEEGAYHDYSNQETNKHHGYDSRANNLLTGNPYDIAT